MKRPWCGTLQREDEGDDLTDDSERLALEMLDHRHSIRETNAERGKSGQIGARLVGRQGVSGSDPCAASWEVDRVIEAGVVGVLRKPVNVDRVLTLVGELCRAGREELA